MVLGNDYLKMTEGLGEDYLKTISDNNQNNIQPQSNPSMAENLLRGTIGAVKGVGEYRSKVAGDIMTQLGAAETRGLYKLAEFFNMGKLPPSMQPASGNIAYKQPETLPGKIVSTIGELAAGGTMIGPVGPALEMAPVIGKPLLTAQMFISKNLDKLGRGVAKLFGGGFSEKVPEYLAQNPEVSYAPLKDIINTGNKPNYPSLWQQTYTSAFNAFKATKKENGKLIGAFKEYAKENSDNIYTTAKDLIDNIDELIASAVYGDSKSPDNLLLKSIRNSLGAGNKLNLVDAEKIYAAITHSKPWREAVLSTAYKKSDGVAKAMEIASDFKKRLYAMYDQIEGALQVPEIARGKYAAIKTLEREIGADAPKDFSKAFFKSTVIGNEDLFDSLQKILPKNVFDKNIATILHMPKKEIESVLVGFGEHGLNLYGMGRLRLRGLTSPAAQISAGALGKSPNYPIKNASKVLFNIGKTPQKLSDFLALSNMRKGLLRDFFIPTDTSQ